MLKSLLLIIFGFCLGIQPVNAQEISQEADKLMPTLTISTDKSHYIVGEPVYLTLKLTNNNNQNIKGYFEMGFEGRLQEIFYQKNNQPWLAFYPWFLFTTQCGVFTRFDSLEPGESRSKTELLLYSETGGLLLSQRGKYQTKAIYNYYNNSEGKATKLESNILSIIVHDIPNSEKEASIAWNDIDLLDFLQGNIGHVDGKIVESGMRKARRFWENYPDSIYSSTCKKELIRYLEGLAGRRTEEETTMLEYLYKITPEVSPPERPLTNVLGQPLDEIKKRFEFEPIK